MKKFVLLFFLFTFGAQAQRFVATYATIADLLSAPPPGAQTNAIVLGRNTPNDNGGGNFYYDAASSTTTNLGTIHKPNNYNGRWLRIWDKSEAKPEWFGAKVDDSIDDQSAIQAALNLIHEQKTGIVKLSAGKYHIATPIRIPYRGVIKGVPSITYAEGSFDTYTNSFWMAGGSTHIRLMNGANCKMVIMAAEDDSNAYIRQASETLEDGSVGDAHFQWSLIEDIVFEGNPANQTEFNCHSIYAERKFSVTIRNCSFAFQSGCPIYFRDVNTGLIENCYFQGSGTAYAGRSCFIYSSADCKIRNIWGFGNEGPLIWFNGDSSFVNTCSDFMIGNSLITNTVWAASSVSTNGTWTFPAAIPLSTGDHVELRTTGTLPTPFTDTTLYFVYKVASNVFTLHTSMPLATNGAYLTPVGGSGTHSFTIGPASALYLSGGARHNDFTGVRCDQNGGPGITIRNAHYNTISGGILSQNYAAVNSESSALTESAGLRIEKDSIGNQVINVNARLQGYAYQLLDTCKSNLVIMASDPLTTTNAPLVTSSNQNNYLVVKNDLGNTVIGSENTQTALYLIGNASGQRVLKAYRHNVGYFGIGVHPQGVTFFNETNSVSIGQFYADASSIGLNLGTSGAPGRLANINGEASTGTDATGGYLKINSGLGTGNGTPSQIQFYTPNTNGISGSTAQVYGQQRFKIDSGGTTFTDKLNLYSVTSDPSDLVDGTAFYRSDTDKFRVRYNSTTANIATEDWVTANFSGGSSVTITGTPTSGQIAEWTSGTAIQGVTATGTGSPVKATAPTLPSTVTIGAAGGTTGAALFKGTASGTVTLSVADAAGTYTIKLPTADGLTNQLIGYDVGGQWIWNDTDGSGLIPRASGSAVQFWDITDSDIINANLTAPDADELKFIAGTGGTITLTSPESGITTHTLRLPSAQGAADQLIKNDGSGQLGYVSPYNTGVAEATVASATTTDLGAVASDKVSITGTTTITGFGTVAAGIKREGRFTGALTLTHNATSLIIPGGASITTAAGDRFQAYSLGSGNWVVSSYTKADGTSVVGGGGIATDPIWDAAGDLVVGTGANTAARLAIGARGGGLYSDGSAVSWRSQRTHAGFLEDFIASNLATEWQSLGSGGGAAFVAGETGEAGIYGINTSTSSTGSRGIARGLTSILLGGGEVYVEWRAKIPSLGSGSERFNVTIGITDQITTPFDGAVFDYADNVNSGNWVIRTTSNGSSTTSNTSTAADTGWHIYGILVNAGATQVDFYIDGSNVGNITGTIPTGAGRNTSVGATITKSIGTTQRDLYVGYSFLDIKFTSSR